MPTTMRGWAASCAGAAVFYGTLWVAFAGAAILNEMMGVRL